MSAAARGLRVSQPTVSRRIATLEAALSTRLFHRTVGSWSLTTAGEAMLDATQRMQNEADTVARQLAGGDLEPSGTVRVSITEGLGIYWLMPRLYQLRQQQPGIDLELVIDNAAVNLSKREADIALRLVPLQVHHTWRGHKVRWQAALIGRRVGTMGVGLYAAAGYLVRRQAPVTLGELTQHDVVGFDEPLISVEYIAWFAAQTERARTALRVNNLTAYVEALKAGWGIGVIPHVIGAAIPDLKRVLPEQVVAPLDLWVVTHADVRSVARIRLVVDFLIGLAQSDAALLSGEGNEVSADC